MEFTLHSIREYPALFKVAGYNKCTDDADFPIFINFLMSFPIKYTETLYDTAGPNESKVGQYIR